MGMYTELVAAFKFKKNISDSTIATIRYFQGIEGRWEQPSPTGFGWYGLFNGDSYYFWGQPHNEFKYDEIAEAWYLTIQFNIKNYDSEIEDFLEWIVLYVEDYKSFIGYMRYEEDTVPTLIYFINEEVKYFTPHSIELMLDEEDED